jgi:Response regulators consisting of a CheY-like receiver domain and a winged-helix DNA-binding domain
MESVHYYRIGADIELYLEPRQLRVEGKFVPLHPKYYAVLLCLVQYKFGIKGKRSEVHQSDLLDAASISLESEGTDNWLRTVIKRLRHVLRDDGKKQSIIKTHHNYGFELLLDVKAVKEPDLESGTSLLLPSITAGKTNLTDPQWGEREQHTLSAQPQRARWGPNDKRPAGISIDSRDGPLIPWLELNREIEERLFNQLGAYIPVNCTAILKDLYGRKDWIVRIISPRGEEVGGVWFGSNPDDNWIYDGLVHVGKPFNNGTAEVWQTFQRFSDGTYRRVRVEK